MLMGGDAGGRDEHQALDALGKGDRELGRDEAAHRVADDRRRVDPELVEQAVEHARVAGDRDLLGGHRRVPEAGQVDRDHAVLARRTRAAAPASSARSPTARARTPAAGRLPARSGPIAIVFTGVPSTTIQRWCSRQSMSCHSACAPAGCDRAGGAALGACRSGDVALTQSESSAASGFRRRAGRRARGQAGRRGGRGEVGPGDERSRDESGEPAGGRSRARGHACRAPGARRSGC